MRISRKLVTAVGTAAEQLEGRVLFSTIAQMEGQSTGTATLDSNPVITTILSQPGTVTARSGATKSVTQYNFLVNDGTGSAEIFDYKPTAGQYLPAVGDTITVTGSYSLFSGAIPELTTITAISKTGTAAVPAPTVSTIPAIGTGATIPQTLEGYPVTLQNVFLSNVTGTTFTSTSQTGKLTDGAGNTLPIFTSTSNGATFSDLVGAPVPSSTTPVNVTGIVQIFQNAPEIVPIAIGTPTVTGVVPAAGPTTGGNTVTINGYGFTNATGVLFSPSATAGEAVPATNVTFVSDQQLTVTAPPGTGTMDVIVSNGNGSSATAAADQYVYTSAPVITGVSPSAGPLAGGTSVEITGSGFTGASTVKFGNTAATSFTVDSPTQITAVDPSTTTGGPVDVAVSTPGGSSAAGSADRFVYAGDPTVTAVSPSSGADLGGTSVTITGSGFVAGATVNFTPGGGGSPVAATNVKVVSYTQITATAPAGTAGSPVDVTVTTPFGTSAASAADQYTYTQTTIAAVESLASGTAVTLNSGEVVTAILSQPGSTNGVNYANYAYLVNDDTGSLEVFGPAVSGYTPTVGDKLSIQGTYSPFSQIPELAPTAITLVSQGNVFPGPAPVTKTIADVNLTTLPGSVAGQLVTLNNVTISGISGTFGTTNQTATITDASGSMTMFYWPTSYAAANAFFNGLSIPTTPVNLTGIVDVFSGTTAEFVPISEPGTFDRFSMTNDATASNEADGLKTVQRGGAVTVTVSRTESTDNATVGYSITPDSATAGADYTGPAGSTTTNGVISGTLTFAAGATTQTFTIATNAGASGAGDKLFTVTLTNPTTDQPGPILPAINSGPATLVIRDPNSSHTLANDSFGQKGEEAVIQPAGPRTSTTNLNINVEANNTTNAANSSFAVLTYNDQATDPSHVFNLPATPVGAIEGIELETVAAPASFDVSGPLKVYLVSNTLTQSGGVYPASTLKFDKTNDPTEGIGTQLGTKSLLGTIQYNAQQAAGGYTPYNLTNLDPTGVAALKDALNNGTAFTIAIAPGDTTATASWIGTNPAATLQSPILRFNYSTSVATAPTIASTQVNDGAAQRSRVRTLTLQFTEPVTLASGAFSLSILNTGGSGKNDNSAPTDITSSVLGSPTNPSGDGKTWVLSFLPTTAYTDASGGLSDGIYTLTTHASAVTSGGTALAGGDQTLSFHRLYGDTDGNKTVNPADYAKFKNAFGAGTGSSAYNPILDFDNNGTINAGDYAQFKKRFGETFNY